MSSFGRTVRTGWLRAHGWAGGVVGADGAHSPVHTAARTAVRWGGRRARGTRTRGKKGPLPQCAPRRKPVHSEAERGRRASSGLCMRAPAWGYKSLATCCRKCVQLPGEANSPPPAAAPLNMDPETCSCPTGETPPQSRGTGRPLTCKKPHALRQCSRTYFPF